MGKRRGSREGTVYQRANGRWNAQISLNGHRISKTAKTEREAIDWLRHMAQQVDQGLTYQATRTTLSELLQAWLAQKKTQLRSTTYGQYSDSARLYILPGLGRLTIQQITPATLQKFYDGLLAREVGARTIQVAHAVLHGVLAHATRLGLAVRNPAEGLIIPRANDREMVVWSEAQISEFMIFLRGQRNEILYHLALATGMRRGELLGLRWSDIDWLPRTITVQRQVHNPRGGGWVFQEPKTKRGIRMVELSEKLIERLHEQQRRVNIARQFARERWQDHDLIFPSAVGTPQSGINLSHEFADLVQQAGLPKIRLHDCRHTAASLMLSHGIPPVIVAGMLGHSLAVLMQQYAHYIPNMQGEAARLMGDITTPIAVQQPAEK